MLNCVFYSSASGEGFCYATDVHGCGEADVGQTPVASAHRRDAETLYCSLELAYEVGQLILTGLIVRKTRNTLRKLLLELSLVWICILSYFARKRDLDYLFVLPLPAPSVPVST